MKRTIVVSALVLFGFSFATMGCSRATVICELVCECEHCNDQDKIEQCNSVNAAEDVASAYDCGEQWDAYTVCFEERGTCEVKESRFSTDDAMGDNKCQTEFQAIYDCVSKASAHDGVRDNFN